MIKENAEYYIDKLLNYYDVLSVVELAVYLGIEPQNISKWKARNSINAIKKKCRELGIYDEIFNISPIKTKEQCNTIILKYSIIGRIAEEKRNKKFNFNPELTLLYRSIKDITISTPSREDIIQQIRNYKISLLKDKLQNSINELNRNNAIEFMENLTDQEMDYISSNIYDFQTIIYNERDFLIKHLSFQ